MPDWLLAATAENAPLGAASLAVHLLLALIYGCLVAGIYRYSHGRDNGDGAMFMTTIVLLSVLIAMVTMVIGNSVARAFSLVGALSIVRFRTVVDDTRDTAFVIFAVIVGMASGSSLFLVPAVGIPIVGAAAIGLSRFRVGNSHGADFGSVLLVRVGIGRNSETLLASVLDRHASRYRHTATSTTRQGAALELTFDIRLRSPSGATTLVEELNKLDGVMGVELREV